MSRALRPRRASLALPALSIPTLPALPLAALFALALLSRLAGVVAVGVLLALSLDSALRDAFFAALWAMTSTFGGVK